MIIIAIVGAKKAHIEGFLWKVNFFLFVSSFALMPFGSLKLHFTRDVS